MRVTRIALKIAKLTSNYKLILLQLSTKLGIILMLKPVELTVVWRENTTIFLGRRSSDSVKLFEERKRTI